MQLGGCYKAQIQADFTGEFSQGLPCSPWNTLGSQRNKVQKEQG